MNLGNLRYSALKDIAKNLLPATASRTPPRSMWTLPSSRPAQEAIITFDDVKDAERASSCILPTAWVDCPLVGSSQYNHDTYIFEFGLPDGKSLELPTCACLLVRAFDKEGKEAIRPYTPISNNAMLGKFQLMIKVYEQGIVSQYCKNMKVGDVLSFKHIAFNCKIRYPFGKKSITMCGGGSGITPMYQALQCLIDTPGDETDITLILGNKTKADILLKDELDGMVARSNGRLKIVHVLSDANSLPNDWTGETGFIDKAKIEKYAYPPAPDTCVFVCGVPQMYEMLCGPRTEKEVKEGSILAQLGYDASMVAKF